FLGNPDSASHNLFGNKLVCRSAGKPHGYGKYRRRIDNRPLLGGTSFEFKILLCYATRVNGYEKYRGIIYSCCMLSGLLLLPSKFVDEFFQRREELIACGVVSTHARRVVFTHFTRSLSILVIMFYSI
ncbi:hypothetical protein GIB67_034895, partial [Kingdonia uniflora]